MIVPLKIPMYSGIKNKQGKPTDNPNANPNPNPQVFTRHKATKSIYQEKLNKERKTFKNGKSWFVSKRWSVAGSARLLRAPF